MIKVLNNVQVYEVNDQKVEGILDEKALLVTSHWNEDSKVVLDLDGKKVTVVARDLLAAINNATNSNRH